MELTAITLDLDDTLWPVWPAIERAEALLLEWLRQHAPATGSVHDARSLRALRVQVEQLYPDRLHDLSLLRLESIRLALKQQGDDERLAEAAFEVFFAARQQVEFFEDVLPALERLAARWPILALSNGNADVQRVGLGRFFTGSLSAREFGRGKPEAAIFHEACARLGAEHGRVLHIGDDGALDVDGALQAGLRAAWVQRADMPAMATPLGRPHHTVADLLALADEIGA